MVKMLEMMMMSLYLTGISVSTLSHHHNLCFNGRFPHWLFPHPSSKTSSEQWWL